MFTPVRDYRMVLGGLCRTENVALIPVDPLDIMESLLRLGWGGRAAQIQK